jgi:hypothetical protein
VIRVYIIYAINRKPGQLQAVEAFECEQLAEAAIICIRLHQLGYSISEILLPTGTSICGEQLRYALTIGVHSVRAALEE